MSDDLSGKVWISSVLSNHDIGMKQGTRTKFYNREWNPAKFEIPAEPKEVYQAARRHKQGYVLQRSEFPEAEAVFHEERFTQIREIFYVGPFLAVKRKLAEALSRFDLGVGGLIPFPIYKADLVTPIEEECFLLNFGARKNTILPEQSKNVVKFAVDRKTGTQIWDVNSWHEDGDVVLTPAALEGSDLWFEEIVYNKIFLSDALASALQDAGIADDWRLKQCRILEAGQ